MHIEIMNPNNNNQFQLPIRGRDNIQQHNNNYFDPDGRAWLGRPYASFTSPEDYKKGVCLYDHPSGTEPNCALCDKDIVSVCNCQAAFHCSEEHYHENWFGGHHKLDQEFQTATERIEQLQPEFDKILEGGINPGSPPEFDDSEGGLSAQYTTSTLYHNELCSSFEALVRMNSGIAIRKAYLVHEQLNGASFARLHDKSFFEPYKSSLLSVLETRIGFEDKSWLKTVNWAQSDIALKKYEITGAEMHLERSTYGSTDVPDITFPIRRIFEPDWLPWTEHSIETLLNHLLLKLKALLALERVEHSRLLFIQIHMNDDGEDEPKNADEAREIQLQAATPLLRWSKEFRRLVRDGESSDQMAQILRCHVEELASHIDEKNGAFWPYFLSPARYIDETQPEVEQLPMMTDLWEKSERWEAKEVLQQFSPAFAETPGAIQWIKTQAPPTQISIGNIRQKFVDKGWGEYVC